jgi:hypothetical protein
MCKDGTCPIFFKILAINIVELPEPSSIIYFGLFDTSIWNRVLACWPSILGPPSTTGKLKSRAESDTEFRVSDIPELTSFFKICSSLRKIF